jgi:hypothetical protein
MITHLCQQSYNSGAIPLDWSTALVSAIFKKGTKSDPANYRPISLTCVLCKVMEHIIVSHLSKHLDKHNILADQQHGFRRRRSCETQLSLSINDWAKTINARGQVDVMLLDFSKAFDMVPHQRLLQKLTYYGVNGSTNAWIEAFLSHRTQKVSCSGTHSDSVAVTSGVPQGSVLGPLLFLLFINDISDHIDSHMRLFADDSIIYREINNIDDCHKLQKDLDTVCDWAAKWQMSFNVKKCHVLPITLKRKRRNHLYTMNGHPLTPASSHPYLGVTISQDLSWNKHTDEVAAKSNKTLTIVQRVLGPCSKTVKERAYTALVRPKLEYATAAWNPHTDRNVNTLEKVQRRAARFVCGDYRRTTSVTGLLQHLGWQSLEHRRLLSQVTLMYKIHTGLVDIVFPDMIQPACSAITRYCHSQKLQHIQCNILVFRYSLFPRMIPVWNSLPAAAITAIDVENFQLLAAPTLQVLRPTPPLRRI